MEKENRFSQLMSTLNESELNDYIANKEQFEEEAILAAIWELEKRKSLNESGKELENRIKDQGIKRKEEQEKEKLKKESEIINDPNAPKLYPKWSITLFAILFTTLFGGILLAINYKEAKKEKEIGLLIVFSVAYTFLIGFLNAYLVTQSKTYNLGLILNILGAVILEQYFWNKKLGKELKYRKKEIWIPLIIGIALTAIFIFFMFNNI